LTRPGYKKTEIGEIPEEWGVARLREMFEIVTGTTPSTKVEDYWIGGTIEWLTPKDLSYVDHSLLLPRSERKITEKAVKENTLNLIPENSIIISTRAPVGYVKINDIEITFNQGCKGLVPLNREKSSPYFYAYYIRSKTEFLNSISGGSTFKELSKEGLENVSVPLPHILEQQKIAEILTTADENIRKVSDEIASTEKLKKGLMQTLLTRGIGHTKSKKTEIGEIPEEWGVGKISELKQTMYYGVTAKATEEDTNLRMLRTTDIVNFKFNTENLPFCKITEKKSDLSKYYLKKDDIVVARAGTVGISVLVEDNLDDAIFGSYLIKIVFNHEKVFMKFIHYYFQSQLYWNNLSSAQGSTIKNINLPFLNSLTIPLPPLPEQQKIAQILSAVDSKLELLRNKKGKLETMKKGLMNDLLTGKVRVRFN